MKTKTKTTKMRVRHANRPPADLTDRELDERIADEVMATLTPDDIRELGEAMGLNKQRKMK